MLLGPSQCEGNFFECSMMPEISLPTFSLLGLNLLLDWQVQHLHMYLALSFPHLLSVVQQETFTVLAESSQLRCIENLAATGFKKQVKIIKYASAFLYVWG